MRSQTGVLRFRLIPSHHRPSKVSVTLPTTTLVDEEYHWGRSSIPRKTDGVEAGERGYLREFSYPEGLRSSPTYVPGRTQSRSDQDKSGDVHQDSIRSETSYLRVDFRPVVGVSVTVVFVYGDDDGDPGRGIL